MSIILGNRSFKGATDAVKISSGTDDGVMSSGAFPFEFYYDGKGIKDNIFFSGDTFVSLSSEQLNEDIKINRRDAICMGLYREDHQDYVRIAWLGYSHYSLSNQTEANRLEWEIYFFKGKNILEIVIGKTPRTIGSVDFFDTKGGKDFNGPFEAGCSYVFEGDGNGKAFVVYERSQYTKLETIERDLAIVGADGQQKVIYPTAIATNTLVEKEDGTIDKLSEILKNLKGGGGGNYEFLPVYPNTNPKEKENLSRANNEIQSQAKRINPFISCSTANRPIVKDIGFQIYDTDLKTPMWWDGEQWKSGLLMEGPSVPEYHLYRAEIYSTNGTVFKNGDIATTLKARLYDFDRDITKELHASQYKWSRISKDEDADNIWDNQHSEGGYEIQITPSDVRLRAVFYLDVVDENGVSLVKCQTEHKTK